MSDDAVDLVIRGGLVIDGTGNEPFEADVAIAGNRIVEIAKDGARLSGREEIDARGHIVTPGFIDPHTHYDGQVTWDNRLGPSSGHGVTTAIMGNCGVGFAPCRAGEQDTMIRLMEGVEDIPHPVLAAGLPWTWESFPEYLDALETLPHDIDFAAYVPHAPLRVYVMGERALRQEVATAEDHAKMAELLKQGMAAGALGFGTSQTIIHRSSDGGPIPTLAAEEAEYMALAMALKEAGTGLIQFVADWDETEAVFGMLERLVEQSGRPLTYTLAQSHTAPQRWRKQIAMTEAASARGHNIKGQVIPRPVGMLLSHALTLNPFYSTSTYEKLMALPLNARIAELRKPEVRASILSEANNADPKNKLGERVRNFADIYPIGNPPNYEPAASESIQARADSMGIRPEELAYDLLLEDNGQNILLLAAANYAEKNLDFAVELLRHPDVVLGLGDGGAHLGTICDASYTTFFLKEWPRSRDGGAPRMDLPGVVRHLTRKPAELVGLRDRGLLSPGYKADINVIDLDKLGISRPEIVTDLPAGGRRLFQRASGYAATLVNGRVIQRDGEVTDELPGKLVRGAQNDPRV